MNIKNLKKAERAFFKEYPGGFKHPEMVEIGKKHKMEALEKFSKECFSKKAFESEDILSGVVKLISRSTMISVFEKPKFRDFVKGLRRREKDLLIEAYYELLHGKEKAGFESLVEQLKRRKLAKWTLVSAVPAYYRPRREIFVKPTTTKLIIKELELDLIYHPTPTWLFYKKYRQLIKDLKKEVSGELSPNNPAFCGFLMMSLEET